jgi:hypothetical protein
MRVADNVDASFVMIVVCNRPRAMHCLRPVSSTRHYERHRRLSNDGDIMLKNGIEVGFVCDETSYTPVKATFYCIEH